LTLICCTNIDTGRGWSRFNAQSSIDGQDDLQVNSGAVAPVNSTPKFASDIPLTATDC
jgi:hypothetical protein